MFKDILFNELVDYVTRDVHPFMEALTLSGRVAANDNAANENEASLNDASLPEIAA